MKNKIIIFPFPFSSRLNKYIKLTYKNLSGRIEEDTEFETRNSPGGFWGLFKTSFSVENNYKYIIHIHWENIIYGSKFLLKSVFLLLFNGVILLFLKSKNYKIVWTMHNFYSHDYPHPIVDQVGRKFVFAIADAVIVQQEKVASEMQNKHKRKKVFFIPIVNYIGAYGPRRKSDSVTRSKLDFSEDDIILLSLGAIKPYKKFDSIIRGFNSLSSELDKRIKLLIAGYGYQDHCQYIEKLARENRNIKIYCRFVEDDKIADFLGLADYSIFWYDNSVLTSAGIMLSLSYGVPVIARNIPAADNVRSGINGYLFFGEKELAEILLNLPRQPKMNPENIIKTVAGRSSEYIAGRLASLYQEI